MSLTDVYNQLVENDATFQKQSSQNLDPEEEAAARIMGRGFMDELNKLASMNKIAKDKPSFEQRTKAIGLKSMAKKPEKMQYADWKKQQADKKMKAIHKKIEAKHRGIGPALGRMGWALKETIGGGLRSGVRGLSKADAALQKVPKHVKGVGKEVPSALGDYGRAFKKTFLQE